MKKEKLRKGNKGITLIALVITIIVLLILAGVAIATLTGENGILTKANQAKTETTKKSAEEKVEIAVLESYGEDGRLDYEALRKNLDKLEGIDKETIPNPITGESFPFTVAVDGTDLEIKANGEVSLAFNAEEWDKTATPEDCFIWGSDTPGEENYNLIVGYTSNLANYTKVRIPSRCQRIRGKVEYEPGDEQVGRVFFTGVKKIEIPNTVKEIGMYAFWSGVHGLDYSLKEVVIPTSVTSIGWRAFCNCKNLSTITIPNSVVTVDGQAFEGWQQTQTINIEANQVPSGWDANWNLECNAKIVYGYTGE